ncbi:MAG: RecA-dependent nuclease [Podoviridae sp. ctQNx1]|nr:MAG: RecA-dependent nuclease [Podoviridae sp. ctQNx1]UOF78092.1 hypothetical protein [Caudoviricetes sp.]
MARVAELNCCCCGAYGVHVHHIREGQGMGQRASDWLTIPLCPDCHTGPSGVHGNRAMLKLRKMSELDLLAETLEKLYG